MSTVLLMTDAWQPTVLRIVPFSSNNARSPDRKAIGRGQNGSRGFPVLAVTRSPNQKSSSANSEARSGDHSDIYVDSDAHSVFSSVSGYTTVTEKTNLNAENSSNKHHRKYAKKKVPEMHSEMKEAIKFSVQDINDQVSSTSSLNSSENKDEASDKHNRVDNTRTRLTKPSLSTSPDPRAFYSPVIGVRRSVPLTPGELELQRIRDSYYIEQVQKRKKYKLNVNQLPRSTTPINDHDPDKLNMKQVIAFLQTKTSKDIHKKTGREKKNEPSSRSCWSPAKNSEPNLAPSPCPRKLFARESIPSLSRTNSDLKNGNDRLDNTRQIPGCMSVMSTKSSPNLPYGSQSTQNSSKAMSTRSGRSYKERGRDKKNDRQRPMKEFKLYRFLAIAPDGQSNGLATTVSDAVPTLEKSFITQDMRQIDSPRKMLYRRNKDRETGTARVLHRHVINRVSLTPPRTETASKDNFSADESPAKAIRLPLMADIGRDSPDVDSDSGSTTSATCNSTKNSSTKEDNFKCPKKGKSISFDESVAVNVTLNNLEEVKSSTRLNGYSDYSPQNEFSVKTHKLPAFPKVNISAPKQIHVNIPKESNKMYSTEIVRLTLRQDKNATRVTSYMSDIQSPTTKWTDENSPESTMTPKSSAVNTLDNSEWIEHSKHHINSISNNSFIKVRQKLKANNTYSVE